jgi:hypothetical protein
LQVNVNVLLEAVSAKLVADPAVARAPVQAPLAVHAVAFRDDHVNTVVAPLTTVVGAADKVTVGRGIGADASVTLADCIADPPGPIQVSVKFDADVIAPVD